MAYEQPAPRPPLFGSLKRAFSMFRQHQMTDWAATLTYFLVMSLFPGLLVTISLLGLFGGQGLVTDSVGYLRDAGVSAAVREQIEKSLPDLVATSGSRSAERCVGKEGRSRWA